MTFDKLPVEFQQLTFSMSTFQINKFVVNSQHSAYKQFKQVLMELEVRKTTEETIKIDQRKNLAEQRLFDEKIAVETSPAQKEIYEIEKEKLITHKNLDSVYDYENNIIYVFDLNFIGDDYDKIINGEYSKISDTSKNILCGYYGITTPEWIYIESYLYPSKYIKTYSEILNVDEDILWDAGELCDKPNMTKEKCIIKLKNE